MRNKKNTTRLLISFLLAVLLWAFALTNTDPTIKSSINKVPVSYINLKEDLVIDNPVSSVDIKVYGRTLQMAKLKKSDITAVVDMSAITQNGLYTMKVNIQGLSENIDVTEISSQYLAINVSNYMKQEYPYVIDFTGKLPDGYSILTHTQDAEKIHLSGSQTLISKVATVKASIKLNNETNDFTQQASVYAYSESGELIDGIELSPSVITVNMFVGYQKTVPIEIKTSNLLAYDLVLNSISVTPNSVTIKGAVSEIDAITSVSTHEFDLSTVTSSGVYEVALNMPKAAQEYSTSRATINVDITKLASEEFVFDSIQVRNTPASLTCDLSQIDDITLTVGMDPLSTSSLEKDDILLYIDLSGLEAGTHEVILQYILPNGVKLISLTDQTVTVTLK